jgi:CheY-like chemotaxis protein
MRKYTIFWADDDPDDLELFHEVLSDLTTRYELFKFPNGRKVLNFLQELDEEDYPCLIILDMNMPVLDGRETLAILKGDKCYQSIPVVVFTTSFSKTDQSFCEYYGTTMITKPPKYEQLKEAVQNILRHCRH